MAGKVPLEPFGLTEEPPSLTSKQLANARRMAAAAAARGWTLEELDRDQRHQLAGELQAEEVPLEQQRRWKGGRGDQEQELAHLVGQLANPRRRAPLVVRRCQHCGEEFFVTLYVPGFAGTRGQQRRFCSDACRQAAYRERKPKPPAPASTPPPRRRCQRCGQWFTPGRGGLVRFCSGACRVGAWRRRQRR